MPINLNKKFSQVPQKESVPYSDENGSLVQWLNNDNVTRKGNHFNGNEELVLTDSTGKIPESLLPSLAIDQTFVVTTQSEMLALDPDEVRVGDICIVTQDNVTYILRTDDPSVLSHWEEIRTREIPVFEGATAIQNGKKGLVPQPLVANRNSYLKGDGTWVDIGTVLHTDLSNIAAEGTTVVENTAKSVCADKDLSNLSADGQKRVLPVGGNVYNVLTKASNLDGDTTWTQVNLLGTQYEIYSVTLTENTTSINLPDPVTDKKFITVCLDNTMLLDSNYTLTNDGTTLTFNSTITASVANPSYVDIKYFTSVSILEQLAPATTSYQGKIALATENEAKAGLDANKAITSATLSAVLEEFESGIDDKLSDKVNTTAVGVANGVASLNNDGVVPSAQLSSSTVTSLVSVSTLLQGITGYDSSKTQVLKHVQGTLQWVDEA